VNYSKTASTNTTFFVPISYNLSTEKPLYKGRQMFLMDDKCDHYYALFASNKAILKVLSHEIDLAFDDLYG
jgi:hypothetical protein